MNVIQPLLKMGPAVILSDLLPLLFILMQPFLIAEQVSKYFYKNKEIYTSLHQVSFEVNKGEIFGIIGQSGAGKSTLMRCLATLDSPSAGKIYIAGQELGALKKQALRSFRKKVGMIFQHFNLLSSRTVEGNVAFPMELSGMTPDAIRSKVEDLLHLVGLYHKKDSYPSQLSGGEKQRVGIARALALEPEILFCDEATSALDSRMTKEILSLLKELNQRLGLTIILITHQIEVIKQICHKVAVLEHGEIVDMGSVSDLFTQPKHPITKQLLQNSPHEIPTDILKKAGHNALFIRLTFRGETAKTPIITQMIRNFDISVNILLGWIDTLQDTTIGSLTVELSGLKKNRDGALAFLEENGIQFEVLDHDIR